MTVPIFTDPLALSNDFFSLISLCYEVHGEVDKFFNLVSDSCVSVNSHYSRALTNPNINLNIVDAIGVRAVSSNGTCINIHVRQVGCQATANGAAFGNVYQSGGINIHVYHNRVRITVPNCGDHYLVMWVVCTSGMTKDPVTQEYFSFNFTQFVVVRGLNLAEQSHGLIGECGDLANY